jgi:hypothetical protein
VIAWYRMQRVGSGQYKRVLIPGPSKPRSTLLERFRQSLRQHPVAQRGYELEGGVTQDLG